MITTAAAAPATASGRRDAVAGRGAGVRWPGASETTTVAPGGTGAAGTVRAPGAGENVVDAGDAGASRVKVVGALTATVASAGTARPVVTRRASNVAWLSEPSARRR